MDIAQSTFTEGTGESCYSGGVFYDFGELSGSFRGVLAVVDLINNDHMGFKGYQIVGHKITLYRLMANLFR